MIDFYKGEFMNDWLNHPLLQNIDPVKLELFKRASMKTKGKSGKDMVPIMMALIASAQRKNIHFSHEEITLILEILKEGKSSSEQADIDRTIQMVGNMIKKYQK